jgi:hypothetical protein
MKETIETQVCTTCGLEKPLSEYYFRNDQQKYLRRCKKCIKKKQTAYYKEQTSKGTSTWQRNPEQHRISRRKHYLKHAKELNEKWREWRNENIEQEKKRNKKYAEKNPDVVRRRAAKRRAHKKSQTPAWADLKKIAQIYKDCPPGYHIDHIFPLKSDKMCGLHVENNLQYLPAKENISKGNRVSLEQQLNG